MPEFEIKYDEDQTVKLVQLAKESELPEAESEALMCQFSDFLTEAQELCREARTLIVKDAGDKATIARCKVVRGKLADIRIASDKVKTKLKKNVLLYGGAVDGANRIVKAATEPTEDYLKDQERFAEREAARIMAECKADRDARLAPFVGDISVYCTEKMSPDGFEDLLKNSMTAHAAQVQAERRAAEKREADEKAERERKEKEESERKSREEAMAEENRRLKAEAAAKEETERLERAAARAEAERLEADARKERDARLKAERELAEKERAERLAALEEEEKTQRAVEEIRELRLNDEYQAFLAANGFDSRTDKVDKEGGHVKLYRLVAETDLL